ncbi:MAG: ChaB family protein [Vulcanimicrobiaceae bacterium]
MTNDDLAPSVRNRLPDHAQGIYREAFNHAWERYGADPRQEEIAHRVAWAAVKRVYLKLVADGFRAKSRSGLSYHYDFSG